MAVAFPRFSCQEAAPCNSVSASNLGCSRRGRASSLMMSRSPCIGSLGVAEPSAAALATVSFSNHVGEGISLP